MIWKKSECWNADVEGEGERASGVGKQQQRFGGPRKIYGTSLPSLDTTERGQQVCRLKETFRNGEKSRSLRVLLDRRNQISLRGFISHDFFSFTSRPTDWGNPSFSLKFFQFLGCPWEKFWSADPLSHCVTTHPFQMGDVLVLRRRLQLDDDFCMLICSILFDAGAFPQPEKFKTRVLCLN